MDRRTFIITSILGGGAASLGAAAQKAGKIPRVGYVQGDLTVAVPLREAFLAGLRERGWIDGQNMVLDWRKRDEEIADLVRLNVDVTVLPNPYRIEAGQKLTKSIPIVAVDLESDPVAKGFVTSLARPGGNLTGVWLDIPELAGKQPQLLKEAVPRLRKVAVVWDDRVAALQLAATEAAARVVNVAVQRAVLPHEDEVEDVVKRALLARPQAILMLTSPSVRRAQPRLAQLAIQHRLPTMSGFSTFPDDGGLMAYSPNFPAIFHQLAGYVDRILRGAKPGDLPVERPTKFELVINGRTAKALGLRIPPSVLGRAERPYRQTGKRSAGACSMFPSTGARVQAISSSCRLSANTFSASMKNREPGQHAALALRQQVEPDTPVPRVRFDPHLMDVDAEHSCGLLHGPLVPHLVLVRALRRVDCVTAGEGEVEVAGRGSRASA
jgi:putative ABC transport system substrate-binding protein